MPLNRLKSSPANVLETDDALPMLQKLHYERKHALALEQVFGRTIICSDLAVAAQYSRSHGVSAITLDGDRVDRRGALTGGYHDSRRSRLDGIKALKTWSDAYERDNARATEVKNELNRLEQEITVAIGKVQAIDSRRKHASEARQPLAAQLTRIQREEEQLQGQIERYRELEDESNRDSETLAAKLEGLEAELRTPFTQTLSDAEIQLLKDLAKQVTDITKELSAVTTERANVSLFRGTSR